MNFFKTVNDVVLDFFKDKKKLFTKSKIEEKVAIYNPVANMSFDFCSNITKQAKKIEKALNIRIDSVSLQFYYYDNLPNTKVRHYDIESESSIDYFVVDEKGKKVLVFILNSETLLKEVEFSDK